jgi:tetratricopeptide (TPR) repeat protein
MLFVITVIVCISFFSIPAGVNAFQDQQAQGQADKKTEPTLADVDKILETKTVENCEKAIKSYKELLKKDPDNYEILHRLAQAYVYIIDIKTSTLIEEKDEYKPILKELGKTANDYAEKAMQLKPDCKEAVAAALVSYGYYSASFGILKAIFKGAAGKYKSLARKLIELDEKYEGGLGYRSLGKLYHVAPWPVGSKNKALKWFKKAVEIDNSSLYAHYYLGLIYFDKDKYDLADKELMFVLTKEPPDYEKHFIKAYKDSAREYIQKVAIAQRD